MRDKETLETAVWNGKTFEIAWGGRGVGFYLFVYEENRCTHDYLQDSIELAKAFAEEEFGVTTECWTNEKKGSQHGDTPNPHSPSAQGAGGR